MRQIDNMNEAERETLALKGMLGSRTNQRKHTRIPGLANYLWWYNKTPQWMIKALRALGVRAQTEPKP